MVLADGTTLAVVFDTHAVNPSLIPNLPFDTLKDLTPLMLVGTGAMALVELPVAEAADAMRTGARSMGKRMR